MGVFGVMTAYLPVVCVYCTVCAVHTQYSNGSIVQISCHNTDYVNVNGHERTITLILAKHCIKLPDDGSLVNRNMLEQL